MREIKFRAWDTLNKKIIYELFSERNVLDFTNSVYLGDGKRFQLMQFTGLKDKNSKEIYESDICKYPNRDKVEVIWHKGTFCYKISEKSYHIFDETQIEIIGNIYENPELLT